MNKKVLAVLVLAIVLPMAAQNENLFKGDVSHGFHFSPEIKWTRVKHENGFMIGARMGWIINHSLSLGFAGYGMVGSLDINSSMHWNHFHNHPDLALGYGGFQMECIFASRKLVHFSTGLLLGAGGVARINGQGWDECDWNEGNEWGDATAFLIAEPEVKLILNLTEHMRMGLGLSYRFIDHLDDDWITDGDLKGAAVSLSFHFGKF